VINYFPLLAHRYVSVCRSQAMRAWSVPKLYTEDVWAASRPFDAAVYYAAPGSRRLRIGVLTDDRFFTPAAACLRAVREAEAALRAAGHEVVAFTPSDHGLDTYKHALNYYAVMAADGGMRSYVDALRGEPLIPLYSKLHSIARLPNWLRPAVAGVLRASGKPRMADLCLYATGKSAYELWLQNAEALVYREAYVAAMRAAGIDIILCPGYGLPATPHGASGDLSVAASWCVGASESTVCPHGAASGDDASAAAGRKSCFMRSGVHPL
jgi:Asp-tRNA(Asn)/Glu-tRNA(Gln) amidotransferase A subunit family amidase